MLFVAEPYRPIFAKLGLRSVETVSRFFLGTDSSPRPRVVVRPVQMESPGSASVEAYFKQYHYRRPAWGFLGRRSKARREFDNYGVFARLQLPAAEALAFGEERDCLGRLRTAFILTRAVPASSTLVEFLQGPGHDRSRPAVRALRKELIRQLAGMTRRIHDAHFFHYDLVWRNVLVTHPPAGAPGLWWIDCPRGGFVRWTWERQRRRIKDLASLDKPAGRGCTRGERVQFIREYLGLRRLDAAAKELIRKIQHYRKHRWPEDWDGD